MEKLWSKAWKASTQARKQRKYLYKAPLHILHKQMAAPISKDLKKDLGIRSVIVKKGDEVTVMSGQFKGVTGKVTKVSLANKFVHVEGAELTRADATKSLYPIHPSNLMIVKLNLDDKLRKEKIERNKKK